MRLTRKNVPSFLRGRLTRDASATGAAPAMPAGFAQPLSRILTIDSKSIDKDARTVEVCFSSDAPVARWGVNEVLSHDAGACDLSRLNDGASVLFMHDMRDYLGNVQNARIDSDRKGRAILKFNDDERATKIFTDITKGVLRFVSVGYSVHEWQHSPAPDAATPDTWTARKWEPHEISVVTVPADKNAGVGRATPSNPSVPFVPSVPSTKIQSTRSLLMNREQIIALLKQRGITVADNISDADLQATLARSLNTPEDARKAITGTHAAIRKIADEFGKTIPNATDLALRAIADGDTAEKFQQTLLKAFHESRTKTIGENATIGLTDKEARAFRFINLFNHLADPASKSAQERAAFELEIVEAARNKGMGKRGIPIPFDVLARPLVKRGSDLISVGPGAGLNAGGAALVETQLLLGSFVELLQNRSVMLNLASKLTDLHGNLDIPKEDADPEAYWLGENDTVPQSDSSFSLMDMTPKTVAALVGITRKMLIQSSISMEAFVRGRIAKKVGLAIDKATLYGTGTDNQPRGIFKTAGINRVDFADVHPTYKELVAMETELADANADFGSLAYVVNSRFRGYAKTEKKFPTSGTDATIWEPGKTVNGTRTEVTNQIKPGEVLYGNFADLLVALWAGMEILTERNVKTGGLLVSMFQDVDYKVLRGESFTAGSKA